VELDGVDGLGALAADVSLEDLSVLVHPEPLVVRWAAGDAGRPLPLGLLSRVPTLTVLVGPEGEVPLDVAGQFDVCVTGDPDPPRPWVHDPDGAGPVIEAVRAQPLACLALATLLRSVERLDPWSGLAAESAVYAALLGSGPFREWRAARPARPIPARSEPRVVLDRHGDHLTITLDRPDRHNAVDTTMRDALVEALQVLDADPTLTSATLQGAGPSFSSGGDLDEFGTVGDPATAHAVRLTRHPGWWVHTCRDRLTVRLHGACIGAGIELAAFASRVVADPAAFMALPEVSMGLVPGAGGTVSVTARIGRQRCAWLAVTGARVDARTAHRWGLVDEISDEQAGRSPRPAPVEPARRGPGEEAGRSPRPAPLGAARRDQGRVGTGSGANRRGAGSGGSGDEF